jgi:hypothetical protein
MVIERAEPEDIYILVEEGQPFRDGPATTSSKQACQEKSEFRILRSAVFR